MIHWSGYDWITQERWGQVHPQKPWNWYDPKCVFIRDGILNLDIQYNPKTFYNFSKDDWFVSPNGTGFVNCCTDFGFGRFEIEAKLPSGWGLWPAFWMWAVND
jgi:beta-glucanase (GH16 family)